MITINFDAKQEFIDCVDKRAVQLVLKQCNSLPKWTNINHMGKFKSEYHQNIIKMSRNFVMRNINDRLKKKIMVIKGGIQIKQLIQLKSSEL